MNSEITKMQAYAEKALLAGNEADAMKFLEQKNQLTAKDAALRKIGLIAFQGRFSFHS